MADMGVHSASTRVSATIGVKTGAAYSMMGQMNTLYDVTRISFCRPQLVQESALRMLTRLLALEAKFRQ